MLCYMRDTFGMSFALINSETICKSVCCRVFSADCSGNVSHPDDMIVIMDKRC